jgi:adenylate cyclase
MADGPEENRARRIVTAARRINRREGLLRAARGARERLLGDDGLGDHLPTAEAGPADVAARRLAQLRGEEPGVLGELGLTALQAWQRLAESQDRGRGKVEVTILFTDLVGFSSWALEAGDEAALRLLRDVAEATETPVAAQRGEVVKRLGDGLMAAFRDPTSAAEAAFAGQDQIAAIEVDGYRPRLRTGIHLGRPRRIGGDYLGVDVNIAARLCDAAKPGEILVSDRALLVIDPKVAVGDYRRFRAKGTPKDLSAYALSRARG